MTRQLQIKIVVVNAVSLFRFLAAFFIPFCAIYKFWLAALILIISGFLSDLVDGFLARRYKVETRIGKIIDLTCDIVFDESIIFGLVLVNQINLWFAAFIGIVIIIIRMPGVFNPQNFWFKLGALMGPVYSCLMLWFIITVYALNALGCQGFLYALIIAIPASLVIIFLKRERIKGDLKNFKRSFFEK